MNAKRVISVLLPSVLVILSCSKSQTPTPPAKPETKVVQPNKIESDLELRNQFVAEIEQHLNKEEFDELEKIADKITKDKERFPGGDWKLDRFYEAIHPPSDYKNIKVNWPERITKLEKWIDQKPKSIYAAIALGCAQIGKAWDTRGAGLANEVSKKQMSEFENQLKQAEATLTKVSDRRKECPHWYRDMQQIGLGLGYDLETMTKYLEEATTLEPLYWAAYEAHAVYLLPRWYGKPGDWERFAAEASNKVGGNEGDILYSEICWRMSRYYQADDFFKENNVNYKRIKKSLNLRGLKYGNSVRYMNAYCLLAGGIGDKTTTKALMNRIGDQWEPDFWEDKKYFDGYKKWASE
jgi:hypothetical protein